MTAFDPSIIPPAMREKIDAIQAREHRHGPEHLEPGAPLSRREMDVLLAIADGDSAPEIAADLGISVDTVATYAEKLYGKLGARNRAHAVALAYHRGILTPRHLGVTEAQMQRVMVDAAQLLQTLVELVDLRDAA